MKFPVTEKMQCPPVGTLPVTFDLDDDDEDFCVAEDLGKFAKGRITSNWTQIWEAALPMLDELLDDYKQEVSASELLRDPANTLNIHVMLPEEDEESHKFRFDLFIEKQTNRGSIVFGVEYADIEAQFASASF